MARRRNSILGAMALSLVALGGAASSVRAAEPASVTLWEARWQYVRLVPSDGPAPSRHPAQLSKAEIRSALAQLRLDLGNGETLDFLSSEEREFYADQAGRALAKAGPGQDVVVCSIGLRKGLFGLKQPKVTTARLFVDEAGLNLIVGEALADAPDDSTYVKADPRLVSFADGRRSGPAQGGAKWKLVGDTGAVMLKRADWAVIPAAAMARPEPGSPVAQKGMQDQMQQMQQQMQRMQQQMEIPAAAPPQAAGTTEHRLRTLEDLKAKGLISSDEYSEKRRKILDSL